MYRRKRRGRAGFLARLSIDQIQNEISHRYDLLLARRMDAERQLDECNAKLAEFDGLGVGGDSQRRRGRGRPRGPGAPTAKRHGPGVRGRGRGGNEQSLPVLLHSLLRGKTMSVPEMVEAAKKAGHKSKSKNFRTIVSLALLNNRKVFRRVARGQYTAK